MHVLAKTNSNGLHINDHMNETFPDDNIQGSNSDDNSSFVMDSNLDPNEDNGPVILDNHPDI